MRRKIEQGRKKKRGKIRGRWKVTPTDETLMVLMEGEEPEH